MKDVDYTISRKEAGKLLKVSIRTVDRYIRSGQLSALHDDRHVLLNKEEILNFKNVKAGRSASIKEKSKECRVDKRGLSTRQDSVHCSKKEAYFRGDRVDSSDKAEGVGEDQSTHKKIFFEQVAGLGLKDRVVSIQGFQNQKIPVDMTYEDVEKSCRVDSGVSTGFVTGGGGKRGGDNLSTRQQNVHSTRPDSIYTESYLKYLFYKIGSMEEQLKSSIPLNQYFFEYKKKQEEINLLSKIIRKQKVLILILTLIIILFILILIMLFINSSV